MFNLKSKNLPILVGLCCASIAAPFGAVQARSVPLDANLSGEIFARPHVGSITVRGSVSDESGERLIGVTIYVNESVGTVTDVNGEFVLANVDEQAILTVSSVGFETQNISLVGRTSLSIVMSSSLKELEEVVVVGYGVQKKQSVVGAISQVNNETMIKSGYSNVTSSLTGKMSGVTVMQQSGEPGANAANIMIRGLSSWNKSNPLVLVDGVERDFSNMDPNEIQTISVLKDASATAVFGARGANGVIIVTTRRGSVGKPKFDISASYGLNKATGIPKHIDSYTTMSMLNVARMNEQQFTQMLPDHILEEYRNPSSPIKALQYPNVNWFEEISNPYASISTANINVRGGTDFVKYFTSFGYQNEGSFFKGYHDGKHDTRYKNDRFNYRANLDFTLTKTTQLSLNLGGDINIKNQPLTPASVWETLYTTGPARFPAYFPDWVLTQVPDRDYPESSGSRLVLPFGERFGNPYTNFNDGTFRKYLGSKVFSDLILNQKLDFITEGLSFKGQASLSTYYRTLSLYTDYRFPKYRLLYDRIGVEGANPWEREGEGPEAFYPLPVNVQTGGLQSDFYSDLYYEGSLNYARTFAKVHSFTGLALWNRQQKNKGTEFPYYNEGFVGRVTYDYANKYLAEVNIGYTGSERFAPTNRYGFFPSGAIGWVVSRENFMKQMAPWVSNLKLRYSHGLVGSDYAENRWLYISNYTKTGAVISEDLGANQNVQWEQARKRDFGIELGVLDNRLTFGVDLYDEFRDKMLLTPRSVTVLVGNSFKELNIGSLKKHGIDFEVEYHSKAQGDFSYFVSGNVGLNENRVVFKDDLPYAPEHVKDAGKPVGGMLTGVHLTNSGYFTSVDDLHTKSAPIAITQLSMGDYQFLDYNGDGAITSLDRYPIRGLDYPPIIWGFTGGLSYKGFDFKMLIQGNVGKYVNFNHSFENEFLLGSYSVHEAQLNYWTPDNPGATHSTLHYFDGGGGIPQLAWGGGASLEGYSAGIENRFWRNADFVRLKDLYLGYTFKPEFIKRHLGIASLNVFGTVNNLLTFTKLIEGDPEKVTEITGANNKYTIGYYPIMVTGRLGVKVAF
jgi:TonB-linked SusC/RagA family outer membrane protein